MPILLPREFLLYTLFFTFLRMNSNGWIPYATFAYKEEYMEQSANEADGGVHDFTCKVTTCKTPYSRKTARTPHACIKIQRGWRERAALYLIEIGSNDESFAHRTSVSCFASGCVLFPGRFRFLRSFWERSEMYKCSTRCQFSRTLSACLRCRALVGTYLLYCFVRGWFRLAVLCSR